MDRAAPAAPLKTGKSAGWQTAQQALCGPLTITTP
jgi:hypothetical protein